MKKSMSVCVIFLFASPAVLADEALIAVAANFTQVAQRLEVLFEQETEHRITITTGSTGSLYAQILNGAPYDVLLAADQERPLLLVQSGNAVSGSGFTYATGRLAVWSANPDLIQSDLLSTLAQREIVALAIPNPLLAPYGKASREALQSLELWDSVEDNIVMGENVGQTHALIATGNAQVGIVSVSLVLNGSVSSNTRYLVIPEDFHQDIRQDAVLLGHGSDNAAARDFLEFIRSAPGLTAIEASGYGVN